MSMGELDKLRELRDKILEVMLKQADYSVLESYNYGDADGTQSTKRRSPSELYKWYKDVCEDIRRRERGSGGIMTFGTNRYS